MSAASLAARAAASSWRGKSASSTAAAASARSRRGSSEAGEGSSRNHCRVCSASPARPAEICVSASRRPYSRLSG